MVKLKCTFAVIFLFSVCEFQSVLTDKVTSSVIAAVLRNKDKDVIFSPILITEGLWQLYLGAEGRTANEISKVLQLNGKVKSQAISEYSTWRQSLKLPKTGFNWANKLFVADNVNILPKYRQQAKDIFQNQPQSVNFGNSPVTTKLINDWAAKETNNTITNVIEKTDSATIAMFLSAIYFKGFWERPFEKDFTLKAAFYIPQKTGGTRTVEVDMMEQTGSFRLNTIDKLDAMSLELPYKNTSFSMVILLPNTVDGIDRVIANLDKIDINDIAPKSVFQQTNIFLPKFKFEVTFELKNALKSLGIDELFKEANLSRLTDFKGSLHIDEFFQKAKIEVDEEGSTASAVQVVRVYPHSARISKDPEFRVNHPFVFLIKDDNAVYFAGRVTMEKNL